MPQYFGRATIAYDGKQLNAMPGASIDLGGVARKPVVTMTRVGYAEELKPATVECTLPISADSDEEAIRQIAGATVTFTADVGKKTWVVKNAFVEETLKLEAKDGGGCKVKISGDPAEKL
jgi:hypothetical protein